MPIYQIKYIQTNRLTVEVEAYNEDDAAQKAGLLLGDPKRFDTEELEIYEDEIEEVVDDGDNWREEAETFEQFGGSLR